MNSYIDRDKATPVTPEELALFPHVRLQNGSLSLLQAAAPCTLYNGISNNVITYITEASHVSLYFKQCRWLIHLMTDNKFYKKGVRYTCLESGLVEMLIYKLTA